MMQFRTTAMTVLSILTRVNSLERRSGTPISSITVTTTVLISTVSPSVIQTIAGIHSRDTMYTTMVDLSACSRSPRRMSERGPTEPAKGAAARKTRPGA